MIHSGVGIDVLSEQIDEQLMNTVDSQLYKVVMASAVPLRNWLTLDKLGDMSEVEKYHIQQATRVVKVIISNPKGHNGEPTTYMGIQVPVYVTPFDQLVMPKSYKLDRPEMYWVDLETIVEWGMSKHERSR